MPEPILFPEWDTNDTNTIEPPQTYKDDGWAAPAGIPEKPPYQYFNWWQKNVYDWIVWLEERFDPNNVYKILTNVADASPGPAYVAFGYQSSLFIGQNMTGDQYYGSGTAADQYYGNGASGAIEIGSTDGSDSTKKVISGSVEATFKEIIDGSKQASTTAIGSVELATNAEAIAGTDTLRVVTPAALKAALEDEDSWNTPTYLNGWAATGNGLKYRLVDNGNTLELTGGVTAASATAKTVFTLPSGFRPATVSGTFYAGTAFSATSADGVVGIGIDSSGNVDLALQSNLANYPTSLTYLNVKIPMTMP